MCHVDSLSKKLKIDGKWRVLHFKYLCDFSIRAIAVDTTAIPAGAIATHHVPRSEKANGD